MSNTYNVLPVVHLETSHSKSQVALYISLKCLANTFLYNKMIVVLIFTNVSVQNLYHMFTTNSVNMSLNNLKCT